MYTYQLPPVSLTAEKPVRTGNQYLFTGNLWVGGIRVTIATTVPVSVVERALVKARGALARVPATLTPALRVRGLDDEDAGALDITSFLDSADKALKSPLGQVARGVLSAVPGVNLVAAPTLAAFDAVQAMRKKVGGKGGTAAKVDRIIRKANVQPSDIKRAERAIRVMGDAARGSTDAMRLIGRIKSQVNAPGSDNYLDSLALDAANMMRSGYELPDWDGAGDEDNEEDDAAGWPDTGCACQS